MKKYAIDRIEENYVICENIKTKEKIVLKKDELNFQVNESNIIVLENNEYKLDTIEEENRKNNLQERLNRLKKLGDNNEQK